MQIGKLEANKEDVTLEGAIMEVAVVDARLVRVVLRDGTGTASAYLTGEQAGGLLHTSFDLEAIAKMGAIGAVESMLQALVGRQFVAVGKVIRVATGWALDVHEIKHAAERDFAKEASELLEEVDEELQVEDAIDRQLEAASGQAKDAASVHQDQSTVALPEPAAPSVTSAAPEEPTLAVVSVPVLVEPAAPATAPAGVRNRWSGRLKRETLDQLVKLANPMVDEVKVRIGGPSEPLISIRAVDSSHVGLVDIALGTGGARDVVTPPEAFEVGLDLAKLKEQTAAMSAKPASVEPTDPLSIPCDECRASASAECIGKKGQAQQKVHPCRRQAAKAKDAELREEAAYDIAVEVSADGPERGMVLRQGSLKRELAILDTEGFQDPKVPNLNLAASAQLDLEAVLGFAKVAKGVSQKIRVAIERDAEGRVKLTMSAEGDDDSVDWTSALAAALPEGEKATSRYNTDFLGRILKALNSAGDVARLEMASDYPVRLASDTGPLRVFYLLAPVETDGGGSDAPPPAPPTPPQPVPEEPEPTEDEEPEHGDDEETAIVADAARLLAGGQTATEPVAVV